ncbi:hypothetical protein CIPAW_13G127000 [Carya illinoinensis]|uniref:Uncharacterized protein n=1 Tax=Carya illinoinensis TaxID=32201 RepID=A0A8T1NPT1_CARIL|nr:hypothetical protein CIPAW_13G127000 [Carya illinoinensis]
MQTIYRLIHMVKLAYLLTSHCQISGSEMQLLFLVF